MQDSARQDTLLFISTLLGFGWDAFLSFVSWSCLWFHTFTIFVMIITMSAAERWLDVSFILDAELGYVVMMN